MLRAKQKTVSILVAFLTLLAALILGISSFFSLPQTTASAVDGTWELVTDVSNLTVGDKIVIAAKDSAVAMSTTQNSNNRGQAAITKSGNNITYTTSVQEITLEDSGNTNFPFAFKVDKQYLYCASTSSKNYLRTQDSKNTTTAAWSISCTAQGVATVKANASVTRNLLSYNSSNSIFACYSAVQKNICIYKWTPASSEPEEPECTHEGYETSVECDEENGQHYSICGNCGAEIDDTREDCSFEETSAQAPTCTEAGEKTLTCATCQNVKTEEIPATGHSFVDGICEICSTVESTNGSESLAIYATTGTLAADSSSISWKSEYFTVVSTKGSTAIRTSDSDHFRAYAGSTTTISAKEGFKITEIVVTCTSADYATVCGDSLNTEGATASVSDTLVTVTMDAQITEVVFKATAQWRLNAIKVSYEKMSDCVHENTTETIVDATCTEEGSITVKCDDCEEIVSKETIDATGHLNTAEEEITPATCTEAGEKTVTCQDCGNVSTEVIPALGHDYVNDICSRCGEEDAAASIDYSGYYYISFTHSETVYYADNSQQSSDRYYAKTEAPSAETVETKYVYRLEKTATGIYSLYEFDGDLYQEDVTVEKVDGAYRFYATVDGDACQFLLNAGSTTKYIKFYKASNATQSNYAQDITLTSVALSADMDSATLTLGDDVAVNYYVNMSDEFAEAKMNFTVNGEMYDVEAKAVDGKYVFTLNLAPQFMAENISAVLLFNDVELDKIENYSIQLYAINKLNDAGSSTELKRLVSDMLHYGAAAQLYRGYKTTELANDSYVVENILAASTAEPAATVREIINNPEIKEYPAYFTSVNVWFDAVNKIIIKVNTTENVTLSIDGGEDVAVTSTTIYTDGILATEFDTTYTFVLKCNGVVMQTLTYSVNSYVYAAIADDSGATDEMKALALALYNYGASAEVYGA